MKAWGISKFSKLVSRVTLHVEVKGNTNSTETTTLDFPHMKRPKLFFWIKKLLPDYKNKQTIDTFVFIYYNRLEFSYTHSVYYLYLKDKPKDRYNDSKIWN